MIASKDINQEEDKSDDHHRIKNLKDHIISLYPTKFCLIAS